MLFSIDWQQPFTQLGYTAPASITRHIITGLQPNTGYGVTLAKVAEGVTVSILSGGDTMADAAGVLVLPAGARIGSFLPLVTK